MFTQGFSDELEKCAMGLAAKGALGGAVGLTGLALALRTTKAKEDRGHPAELLVPAAAGAGLGAAAGHAAEVLPEAIRRGVEGGLGRHMTSAMQTAAERAPAAAAGAVRAGVESAKGKVKAVLGLFRKHAATVRAGGTISAPGESPTSVYNDPAEGIRMATEGSQGRVKNPTAMPPVITQPTSKNPPAPETTPGSMQAFVR